MIRWQMTTENSKYMQAIQQAGDILSKGGLVAFPTETVYGLGANALNEMAVSRVFAAKQRPADNPLIVHIADLDQLQTVTIDADNLSRNHKRLMDVFWPGPLTL